MSELTLIIPFLNEGYQVLRTVKSFAETADEEVGIILINDGSTDGYDYPSIAKEFNATYIEHKSRIGVAASRDEGVDSCSTSYFMLLDAHMRPLQTSWASTILSAIRQHSRTLLCCATKGMLPDGSIEHEDATGYGGIIDFNNLSVGWNYKLESLSSDNTTPPYDIPCVLGASYICEKEYWQYLKGLSGLINYGLDEQYISLKVWLEGGSCKLLPQVQFGHLFRTIEQVPYKTSSAEFVANQLLVAELLLEQEHITTFYRNRRAEVGYDICDAALQLTLNRKEEILSMKSYLKKISNRSISQVMNLNRKVGTYGTTNS